MRLSHEMDSLMSMMHSQIKRAISSVINDRVIPEIQNLIGSLSSGHRDTESGMSCNDQENNEQTTGLKTNIAKKDSVFDLRDTGDLNPYTRTSLNQKFQFVFFFIS